MTIIRHMIVHGRVQGVGFRAFVEGEALARGLEGWARNRRDGSVEAVFMGEAATVAAMIEACRRGPFGARVDVLHQREGSGRRAQAAPAGRIVLRSVVIRSGAEQRLELPPQHHVDFRHRHRHAEIGEAGDAVALLAHPARYDAGKMREVGIDVERHAVQRDPMRDADADGGDLVLVAFAFFRPAHPDADAVLAPLAAHVEAAKRADDPFLQRGHVAAHVRETPLQVEHHIGHALARPVIGHLPAAPALEYRKARRDQLVGFGAGAGCVKGRVLDQPDQLGLAAGGDTSSARLHEGDRRLIRHEAIAHAPLHARRSGRRCEPNRQFVAYVSHTLPYHADLKPAAIGIRAPALVPQDPICYRNRASSGREVFQRLFVLPTSMIPKKPVPAGIGAGNRFSEKIMLGQNYAAVAELVDALA